MEEFNRGDLAVALDTLQGVMARDRSNGEALILAATIHEQLGNRNAAAAHYAGAIDHSPTLRRELAFRAATHFLAVEDRASAISALLALRQHEGDDIEITHSLCSLYRELGDYEGARPFAEFLADKAERFGNLLNGGIVLAGLNEYEKAYPALLKAWLQNQDERLALSELFWCASNLCDLDLAEALQADLERAYAEEGAARDIRENAFRSLFWTSDEAYQQDCARLTAQLLLPPVAAERPAPRAARGRIRVGYLSCDFYEHATMSLFAGVLEAHDRDRFEIYGICHTPEARREGPMRERFLDSVDFFIDILDHDDQGAAELIRSLELDVLVDLKGFTQGSRIGIFCLRPAPVQVSYLGFPGSVSGIGIDYALTDAVVTPPSSEAFYEEKLLRLDPSYQANDAGRAKVVRRGRRAELGLPEDAVVFSAFHQAPKIRRRMFAAWMEILRQVEGAVLWIGPQPELARTNLRRQAEGLGIDAERLIFAPQVSLAGHLERLTEADIALDSAPCNGHTTTSDALWCGVPVVTVKGGNFAGRVSESLLRAVGLPELVAADLDEFVRLAVDLAQDGIRQSRLRQHLIDARSSAPLFDTAALTRQIEGHFAAILG